MSKLIIPPDDDADQPAPASAPGPGPTQPAPSANLQPDPDASLFTAPDPNAVQVTPLDKRWKGYDTDKPPGIHECEVCGGKYEHDHRYQLVKLCWRCKESQALQTAVASDLRWSAILRRTRDAGITEKLPANCDSIQEYRYGTYGMVMTTPRLDRAAELLGACCSIEMTAILISDPPGVKGGKTYLPSDLMALLKGESKPAKFPVMKRFYQQRWAALTLTNDLLAVEVAIDEARRKKKLDIGDWLKYVAQKAELAEKALELAPVEDQAETDPSYKQHVNKLAEGNDEAVEEALHRIMESGFRTAHGMAPER